MIFDLIFRIAATTANAVAFAYIVFAKMQAGAVGVSLVPNVVFHACAALLLGGAFFYIHFKLIADQQLLLAQPRKREAPERALDLNSIVSAVKDLDISETIRENIRERLRRAERVLGKDRLIDALWRQHQVCVDNEKFYEQIAWQVGIIFVPVGLGLGTLGLQQNQAPGPVAIIAGFLLFATWVLLFRRFRTSLRLYRECAQIIEQLIGMFAVSYVYSFAFHKYGPVIRVWPYLVALLGGYFNYTVAMVL